LTQTTLSGPVVVWKGLASSPVTLTTANFNATSSNTTQRTLPPGQTLTLTLHFEKNVSKTKPLYIGAVKFGTNSACVIPFPRTRWHDAWPVRFVPAG